MPAGAFLPGFFSACPSPALSRFLTTHTKPPSHVTINPGTLASHKPRFWEHSQYQEVTMNAPERSASFLLDEDSGEVKIVYSADTKVRARTILIFATLQLVYLDFVRLHCDEICLSPALLFLFFVLESFYCCR
jgi:hypothetical protein